MAWRVCPKILSRFNSPFIIFFVAMLIFHFTVLGEPYGDDIWFGQNHMFDASNPANTFWAAVVQRAVTWSSRFISDWLTFFFAHGHYSLWKILNSFFYVVLVWSFYHIVSLVSGINETKYKWLSILFFLLYPLRDMQTAGWMATTINYIWNYACFFYFCTGVCDKIYERTIHKWEYILYALALVASIDFEQTLIGVFGVCLIWWFVYWAQKRNMILPAVLTGVVVVCGAGILMIPGNMNRFYLETGSGYPWYQMLSVFDKFNLGLFTTMYHFAYEAFALYIFFYLQLLIYIWSRYRERWYRFYSIVPLMLVVLMHRLPIAAGSLPGMTDGFVTVGPENITKLSAYFPIVLSSMLFLWPCLLIYMVFVDDLHKAFIIIFIYLFGMLSHFMMGFSPTLYASGDRTFLGAFLSMIMMNLFLYKQLSGVVNRRIMQGLTLILILCAGEYYVDLVSFAARMH